MVENIIYISSIVSSVMVILTFLGLVFKPTRNFIMKKMSHSKTNDAGVCCLLRQAIISECKKADEQGFIYLYDEENLRAMFKSYSDLGGNGSIEDLVNKTLELEIKMNG